MDNGEMTPGNYALGFRVGEDDVGRFVHHGDMSIGGYSFLIIYPDIELVVVMASNVTPIDGVFDRFEEAKKLVSIFTR